MNRNELQGDGRYTGIEFRNNYLSQLDNEAWWQSKNNYIVLDFNNVKTLSPSWANEVFSYFTRYIPAKDILNYIRVTSITEVKQQIIQNELMDV